MRLEEKLLKLEKIIFKMGSVLVAFSGGLDSTFLLKAASRSIPKNKILAVTASSATYPKQELLFSKRIAKDLGLRHKIIRTCELEDKKFASNTYERCYFCKKELFSRLRKIAEESKIKHVLDASNISDRKDFRPGNRAKQELKIRSPLQEAGLNKDDIRRLSKKFKLPTWDKPPLACLASRIPYGIKINSRILRRINTAEDYLRKLGFKQVRLRHYNNLGRIEVLKKDIPNVLRKSNLIIENLKKLGYDYITVDLQGYRTGSMNLKFPKK